ncbi:hypothetical protein NDU88_000691 [Pleurodeles waltl]|uniref:Uncharacterized protein n=1 Tax=Pleurodeles waltl TaxID=8319 RepID=A0AAV7S9D6_PLEWA|nr:hypothetical protein NDU88_000691 [Pleurodeles waltl]
MGRSGAPGTQDCGSRPYHRVWIWTVRVKVPPKARSVGGMNWPWTCGALQRRVARTLRPRGPQEAPTCEQKRHLLEEMVDQRWCLQARQKRSDCEA